MSTPLLSALDKSCVKLKSAVVSGFPFFYQRKTTASDDHAPITSEEPSRKRRKKTKTADVAREQVRPTVNLGTSNRNSSEYTDLSVEEQVDRFVQEVRQDWEARIRDNEWMGGLQRAEAQREILERDKTPAMDEGGDDERKLFERDTTSWTR